MNTETEQQEIINTIKGLVTELNRLAIKAKEEHGLQVDVGGTSKSMRDEWYPFYLSIKKEYCY
jgi:hypothetical protein